MNNPNLIDTSTFLIVLVSPVVLYFLWKFKTYYIDGKIQKNGMLYSWEKTKLASAANPPLKNFISGHYWSSIEDFKRKSKENLKKNPVYIANFSFFKDFVRDCELPAYLKNSCEKEKFYADANMMCRSVFITGGAGGGKTVTLLSIASQPWYSKGVFYSKKGTDYEPYFFRGKTIDILVNPKLSMAAIHNILDEPTQYVDVFVQTIVNASIGEKADFFSSSARDKLEEFLQDILIKTIESDLSIPEKWEMLLSTFEKEYAAAMAETKGSKKDVFATLKLIMKPFYLSAYRIIETKAETFTVKDFLNSKHPKNLFFNAADPSVEGILAATYTVLVKTQLAMPNNWSDKPVLHLQDEYNSLSRMVGEEILNEVREVGRSKMFAPVAAAQGITSEKAKAQQLLINMQYFMAFAGSDTSTLDTICDLVGTVKYIHHKENTSYSNGGKNVSLSEDKVEESVITPYHLNILQEEGFNSIFVGLKEKILFKGYTPPVKLQNRGINYLEEINTTDYTKWLVKRRDSMKTKDQQMAAAADDILTAGKF